MKNVFVDIELTDPPIHDKGYSPKPFDTETFGREIDEFFENFFEDE